MGKTLWRAEEGENRIILGSGNTPEKWKCPLSIIIESGGYENTLFLILGFRERMRFEEQVGTR
jgi:hypothetical protein